jgi:hypothetical protein
MRYLILLLLLRVIGIEVGSQIQQQRLLSGTLISETKGRDTLIPIANCRNSPVPSGNQINQFAGDSAWHVGLINSVLYINRGPHVQGKTILPFKTKSSQDSAEIAPGKVTLQHVEDGFLVGINRGSVGGDIYWMSFDRKTNYLVSKGSFIQFFRLASALYVMEGCISCNSSKGRINLISKLKGRWQAKEVTKLDSEPLAIGNDSKNNLIVVTSTGITRVTPGGQTEILAKGFWSALAPASLAIKEDIAYIGMKGGVLKFDLQSKEQGWIIP